MDALKRRFQERAVADRVAIIDALDRVDRPELLRLAHGLSGIAGIFGYADVSAHAAALEAKVEEGCDVRVLTELAGILVAALDAVGRSG